MSRQMVTSVLLRRARKLRAEVEQIFVDADHWNQLHGADQKRIDPDPVGEMQRLADYLDSMIATLERSSS